MTEPAKWMTNPTLIGEQLDRMGGARAAIGEPRETENAFPFRSWAFTNHFSYPGWAAPAFYKLDSAPEAFFLREFTNRPGAAMVGETVVADSIVVTPQLQLYKYRIDFAVVRGKIRLGVEIDGAEYHRFRGDWRDDEYKRERRLLLGGYAPVRFTGREAYRDPAECWRQVDYILDALEKHR